MPEYEWMSTNEAAEREQVHERTMRNWCRQGLVIGKPKASGHGWLVMVGFDGLAARPKRKQPSSAPPATR